MNEEDVVALEKPDIPNTLYMNAKYGDSVWKEYVALCVDTIGRIPRNRHEHRKMDAILKRRGRRQRRKQLREAREG